MWKKISSIVVSAAIFISCFASYFVAANGFQTNITGWKACEGNWEETEAGYRGSSGYPSLAISDQQVNASTIFKYSGTIGTGDGGLSIIQNKDNWNNDVIYQFNVSGTTASIFRFAPEGGSTIASAEIASSSEYFLEVSCNGAGVITFQVNGNIVGTLTDTNLIGYLGLRLWDQSLTFNNLMYTAGSAFDTNMPGWTGADSCTWERNADGFACTTWSGKHAARSNVVIDGSKSFVYEVSGQKPADGYGAGIAFGVTDVHNLNGIEFNRDGAFYFPALSEGQWSTWYEGGENLTKEQLDAASFTLRFEYNAEERSAQVFLNGRLMKSMANIDINRIKGNLGFYGEESTLLYTKAIYTELLPDSTELETNLSWTIPEDGGVWVLTKEGYRNVAEGYEGRNTLQSNVVVDGTKSFTYELLASYSGYGLGLAFDVTDSKNFSAIEINRDGGCNYPYRINNVWANYFDSTNPLTEEQKNAEWKKMVFSYDAETQSAVFYLNDVLMMSIENIDVNRIKGNLGIMLENASVLVKKAVYTEAREPSDLETNLENWEAVSGTWTLRKEGYASESGGRSFLKSDKKVDPSKSFVYEVELTRYTGYGVGFAFGLDGDNYAGMEFNNDGHFSLPYRLNGEYALLAGEVVPMTEEQKAADTYQLRMEYNAASKTIKAYLNGILMCAVSVDPAKLAGNVGLFTEDGQAVYTKAIFTETAENPESGDPGTVVPAAALLLAAILAVGIRKRHTWYA